ncbi:hypothetical protein NL50_11365 [Clostridium acetobutylicum]|nr:hypothetical protein NL50_11365 [Clostridium acetobutylicum]
MKKDDKLGILFVIMILTAALLTSRIINIHRDFKKLKPPTIENREVGDMGVFKWLTVRDIAKRHNVSEEEIFKILGIKNVKGDENVPIRDLLKKYKKNKGDIRKSLIDIIKKYGGKQDERL